MSSHNTNPVDYVEKYGLKEHHDRLLAILVTFDSFCRKNKINYSIEGGTLLGAIRHGGFIPWDDDADLSMKRCDYIKLCKTLEKQKESPIIIDYFLWIPRIRLNDKDNGEFDFVDLFIFDKVPKSSFLAKIKRLNLLFVQGMMHHKPVAEHKRSFISKCLLFFSWVVGRVFTTKCKFKLYHRISQWGKNSNSNYYMIYDDTYKRIAKDNHVVLCDIIEDHIDIHFEQVVLSCYKRFDELLKIHYGNYHIWPPEECRKPEHFFYKSKEKSNEHDL